MTTEVQQYRSSPPLPPDEGYWEALLKEGEIVAEGGLLGRKTALGTTSTSMGRLIYFLK